MQAMEKTKSITLIALAVFSIVILLAQNNINHAYAVILHTYNLTGSVINNMDYMSGTVKQYVSFSDTRQLNFINANTLVQTSTLLPALSTSKIYFGFDCTANFCYILNFRNIADGASYLAKIDASGNVVMNVTVGDAYDTTLSQVIGSGKNIWAFDDGSVFIFMLCDSGKRILDQWNMGTGFPVLRVGACDGTVPTSSNVIQDVLLDGTKLVLTTNDATLNFQIWNLGGSRSCASTIATYNSDTGRIIRPTGSSVYLVTNLSVGALNTINSSCTSTGSVTSASTGLATQTNGILYDGTAGVYYLFDDTEIAVMNATSPFTSRLAKYSTDGVTVAPLIIEVSSTKQQLVWCGTLSVSDTCKLLELQNTPPTSTTTGTVCIDTGNDGITDVCFTDTNGDGVPDAGAGGALTALRTGGNITQLGFSINCAFGIGSCTDQNPKTNGVGLVYFLVLLIISYACLVAIHIKAVQVVRKENVQVMDYLNINPLLLLVVLVVDLGITWQFQWIPDLLFYTIIVIMVAGIAGFAFYKKLRGD